MYNYDDKILSLVHILQTFIQNSSKIIWLKLLFAV